MIIKPYVINTKLGQLTDDETNEVVDQIIIEYAKGDVCLDELLNSLGIQGMTINDVVKVYAKLFKQVESDKVQRIREGEVVDLTEY